MKELLITRDTAGGRMDKAASKFLDKAPKGFIYKMLRKKNIVLNDKKAQGNEILKEGDRIRFYLSDETIDKFRGEIRETEEKRASKAKEEDFLKPAVVFEDQNLLAFNKPAGMLSQKAKPSDYSLNEYLLDYLKPDPSFPFTPGISNRLDRNTSGIVLAGKTPASSRELNSAIKERRLDKKYLCLVKGVISDKKTIEGFLVKDEKNNKVRILNDLPEDGKGAFIKTAYEPLKVNSSFSLLEVDLITGKSHQIRAHLASIGHPLIGDTKYGDRQLNGEFRNRYGLSGQLLHAGRICFREMEGVLAYLNGTEIQAPLPEIFDTILRQEFGK